jgi:hypothetical protein
VGVPEVGRGEDIDPVARLDALAHAARRVELGANRDTPRGREVFGRWRGTASPREVAASAPKANRVPECGRSRGRANKFRHEK